MSKICNMHIHSINYSCQKYVKWCTPAAFILYIYLSFKRVGKISFIQNHHPPKRGNTAIIQPFARRRNGDLPTTNQPEKIIKQQQRLHFFFCSRAFDRTGRVHTRASLTSRVRSTSGTRSRTARVAAAMWCPYQPKPFPSAAARTAPPMRPANSAVTFMGP